MSDPGESAAMTRWYWKSYVDGWFLWGVWIRSRWFVGVARTFNKPNGGTR